jgi:hypothetical protein
MYNNSLSVYEALKSYRTVFLRCNLHVKLLVLLDL